MNNDDDVRYARQHILEEIGQEGQCKIQQARILVIGAGGLGCPLLYYLAAAGIGHIGIMDGDTVNLCNLQRQILFKQEDIGRKKVDAAFDTLYDFNNTVTITPYPHHADSHTLPSIIKEYDIIVDCTDHYPTRMLINQQCITAKRTLISAAVEGFTGQIYNFRGYLASPYPCYACLYPDISTEVSNSCEEVGILGSVAGMVGSMQASEVLKSVLELTQPEGYQSILTLNALTNQVRSIDLQKDPACSYCS